MTEETNDEFINRHLAAIKQKIAQAKESYDHDQLKQAKEEERPEWAELAEREKQPKIQTNNEITTLHELALAYEKYIQILGLEINDLASAALFRGWDSDRVEQGKQLRELIQTLKKEAGIDHTIFNINNQP